MATGGETKKRASIVTSLTLWYVSLTIVNIGVFWVGAGSNQTHPALKTSAADFNLTAELLYAWPEAKGKELQIR